MDSAQPEHDHRATLPNGQPFPARPRADAEDPPVEGEKSKTGYPVDALGADPRGDGEDPPDEGEQTKTGGYPVDATGTKPRGDGEDPPDEGEQSKTGYDILSQ